MSRIDFCVVALLEEVSAYYRILTTSNLFSGSADNVSTALPLIVSITRLILSETLYSSPLMVSVIWGVSRLSSAAKSVTVVVEHSCSLLIVKLRELLEGMMSWSCAFPQYFTKAILIGDFSLTLNYLASSS